MKKNECRGRLLEHVIVGGMLILVAFLFSRPEVSNSWRIGLALLGLVALASRLASPPPQKAISRAVKQVFFAWLGFVLITVVASALGATFTVAALELVRGFLLPATIPFLLFAFFRDLNRFGWLCMAVVGDAAPEYSFTSFLFRCFDLWTAISDRS